MLRKDGVNITKDIKKKFKKELELIKDKKQVTFRLAKSIYDGKNRKPRSYHIPNAFSTQDSDGNVSEFIFYNSIKNRPVKGGPDFTEYLPLSISFSTRGDLTLNVETSRDLIVFLLNHPRIANNKNGDSSKKALFYLEDKNIEARERVQSEQAKIQMDKYIFDEENRLPEKDLRTIAKAMNIPGVDQMNLENVQVSLADKCKKNPQKFLNFKGVGEAVEIRSELQEAIERGVIKYDPLKRKWVLVNSKTKEEAFIAPVRQTSNEMDELINWLENVDTEETYSTIIELSNPGKKSYPKRFVDNKVDDEAAKIKAESENILAKAEIAKAEAEKAKAEAEEMKAKAEIAKAEAEKAKAEMDKSKKKLEKA